MSTRHWAVVGLITLCAASTSAAAQEKRLKRSDLPPAVRKAADEQSKGATVRGYSSETENGQLEYEVAMTVNGRSRDVSFAADASILEIEQEVPVDSLPAAVHAALVEKAGAGRIMKVESLTKHGTLVAYEAQVRTGAKRSEIQVGPDGKPLAREE